MKFTGMLKDDTLKGKVILITGGGTGLGKSMGAYFMELGANLIITSRKQEVLNKTAEEFSKYTGEVLPIAGDVRDHKDVKNVINKLRIINYPSVALFHDGSKVDTWKADMDGEVECDAGDIKKAISEVMAGDQF